MQVFSIWGPLLSTFVGCLQSMQGKHFCFCKLWGVLWFMFSRGYAQFKFCCKESAVLPQLENSIMLHISFFFYNMKSFIIEIISIKEKKAPKMKV